MSAVAPASAPASAEFWAWLRAVIIMPTSMASMLAARNPMNPTATNTSENPDSSVASVRRRLHRMMNSCPEDEGLLDALFLVHLGLVSGLRLLETRGSVGHRLLVLLQLFLALAL